jgi:UDP-N-acetylglucosamine:LPS N-acetylglucosamine transferase
MRVFEKLAPNLLVSVHPMTQHFFAHLLRRLHLTERIPLVTVVTDPCYGFWRGWACDDVQQYYVASDDARQQLIDYGVGSHKIKVFGMPVHSRFVPCETDEKRALRQQMGLDPDKFTLFMNAGWVGGGNIPNIYESLVTSGAEMDIQTVFLAGNNERLLQDAHEMARAASFPVKVLGYSDEIEQLMNASDVMVSKLGGLTTFEALACQLPIIGDAVTEPMPQEAQTASYIERTGTGVLLKRPDQIVSVVKSLIDSPEQYQALREATRRHGKVKASDNIAQDVLRYLNPSS